MKYTPEAVRKIKLIIWDLDETFWKGTLSDHNSAQTVIPIETNCTLVKTLSKRGIVNAVCSKNERSDAETKLKEFGVLDYFVFNSINWEPKGVRIQTMLSNMALRPENVLFLDDNPSNLAEAEFVLPSLMVAGPEAIDGLVACSESIGKDDSSLSRLEQYKLLERKTADATTFSSNLEFLRSSEIKICINENVSLHTAERIAELIERSNQLNFTKKRIPLDLLQEMLDDSTYRCGYVSVSDRYGVYGIVGFYAVKDGVLEHFLFSCRTMGMGIEQYVYTWLDYPQLTVVEPVSGSVSVHEPKPDYITLVEHLEDDIQPKSTNDLSILIKGPCDLEVMASYLENSSYQVTKEFNFVDSEGNQADFYNHTANILQFSDLSDSEKDDLSAHFHFLSRAALDTSLFNRCYDIICLSPLMDATLGLYREKNSGLQLAYGLSQRPITDSENWEDYCQKKIMTARSNFDTETLATFSEKFETVAYTPQQVADNFETLIDRVQKKNPNTQFIILLLSELAFEGSSCDNFFGKETLHRAINLKIKEKFANRKDVSLLDVNKFIVSQSDYFDNINHYSKMVYYQMAQEFNIILDARVHKRIPIKSELYAKYQNFRRSVYKRLFLR